MKLHHLVAVFGVVLFASGCATPSKVARARGAHDLGCNEKEASVTDVPGGAYEVSCPSGDKATYVCLSTNTGIICSRDN